MKAVIPNVLSVLRILLAPVLLTVSSSWRLPILIFTMVSDFFDGFLARRWGVISKFGTIADPIGDKVIAVAISYLCWNESFLTKMDLIAIFLRDIVVVLFTVFLLFSGKWAAWKIQSFWCGKMATAFQGILFVCVMSGYGAPSIVITSLVVVGIIAPFELIFLSRSREESLETLHK
jgi:cardiolipin synthase (CMP-forming)